MPWWGNVLYALGVTLVAAVSWLSARRLGKPTDDAIYERGRTAGYEEGYVEGKRQGWNDHASRLHEERQRELARIREPKRPGRGS